MDGAFQILLAKGDKVLQVKAGDALDDGYRVESLTADSITLVYVPMNAKTTIQFTTAIAASRETIESPQQDSHAPPASASGAAQRATAPVGQSQAGGQRPATLAWEGPERVRIGSQFNVTLRITSEQPVSASPMQLRFDPAELEPLGVRPGRLYASGRGFSFRVNPEGSIFVGASSAHAAPASDAELLVLTFRPLRPAAAAQVNVASLSLQGVAGRAIAHEQFAAFRTTIGQ